MNKTSTFKTYYFLLGFLFLSYACSWGPFAKKKVECCENEAACCYGDICCLPRYARAAGQEPKSFTPSVPVYGSARDFEPAPGETITTPGILSEYNPFPGFFGGDKDEDEAKPARSEEDQGFLSSLWPF